jgi:hypothetical protein
VSHQPDLPGVDVLAAFEKVHSRHGVVGKVAAGGRPEVAGRFAHAAVIDAQHGNPAPGKVVGHDQERLVAHQFLVAVLRAGARNEQYGREGPLPSGSVSVPASFHVRRAGVRHSSSRYGYGFLGFCGRLGFSAAASVFLR